MNRLLVAGVIYLIGISIVLAIKPSFMFTEDGIWKEFGIGRNPNTHTWMPFWLFAVLWALISYILTSIFFIVATPSTSNQKNKIRVIDDVMEVDETDFDIPLIKPKRLKSKMNLSDGYYILNREATEAAGGIPKYVFLGRGLPESE
jgi:hypothetical protein